MKLETKPGKIYPLGVSTFENGINFAFVSESDDCGIIFYEKDRCTEKIRFSFPVENCQGNIHTLWIGGLEEEIIYAFYESEVCITDRYAHSFVGNEEYANIKGCESKKAFYFKEIYDWENDKCPDIAYEEMIAYCLHVRGFTKHISSKVKEKGTFKGLVHKIPYLKDLGITTLELQPIYEYDEIKTVSEKMMVSSTTISNYWGYQEGYYYSPKTSFSYTANPIKELKDMIKSIHKNNMEVIMQFYFPKTITEREISDILRFWVIEYHIDGFHIKGDRTPITLIKEDPCFTKTKIWYYDFDQNLEIKNTRLGIYNDNYRYDMRRFLKGDEGMALTAMSHMRKNPAYMGKINYFTNYDGFTLMDLVSFERKHNEDNKEENRDGNDFNYSWNCGVEGKTRKKNILSLRFKQMKNALCILFFSQGTPLIFMGDEFGNTQNGNNNPYCQDNETTWLNWKNLDTKREIYDFIKLLISLRKEHPILHNKNEFRLMDYISCGYPDLSYHGESAWRPNIEYYSRQIGIMLCGKYSKIDRVKDDDFFYIAINMHWEKHKYALPKLPKNLKWQLLLGTEDEDKIDFQEENAKISLPPRSIFVLIGK